jgi:hypothetical protein
MTMPIPALQLAASQPTSTLALKEPMAGAVHWFTIDKPLELSAYTLLTSNFPLASETVPHAEVKFSR